MMRKYYIAETTLAQNDPFQGCMGIYEDKDVDARIAELEKALREAMEWNWLDEDMNQGVANACERVLNGGTF
jgi:hypothetical protein